MLLCVKVKKSYFQAKDSACLCIQAMMKQWDLDSDREL